MRAHAVAGRVLIALLASSARLHAQEANPVGVVYEYRVDRYTYRFDNPSSFDTPDLVPHFFEQRYVADNHWLLAGVGYGSPRLGLSTHAGVTPEIVTSGDDYDTFLQPNGDVVTSGTTGHVSLRSWWFEQRVNMHAGAAIRVYAGYRFQRDRARFHEGYKTVTHTQPPSVEASIVTTRETTTSDVHEVRFGVDVSRRHAAWTLAWETEASPTAMARLTVDLPDKYPGRSLHFWSKGAHAATSLGVMRAIGPVEVGVHAGVGRNWSYDRTATLQRTHTSLGVRAAWRRSP